jgi:RNA polymerase sigma factor (sigma-70 family)
VRGASNSQIKQQCALERIGGGDSAAVGECIAKYGGLIWTLTRRMTRTRSCAEDATQEIFIHIWRCASSFDPAKGSEAAFIVTIARRRLIDRLRKSKTELLVDSSVDLADVADCSDPYVAAQTSAAAKAAIRALEQLKPNQRRMLELSLLHGLSQSENAAQLRIPLGTVKSRLRRGLMRVRECMKIQAQSVSRRKPPADRIRAKDSSPHMRSSADSMAAGMSMVECNP